MKHSANDVNTLQSSEAFTRRTVVKDADDDDADDDDEATYDIMYTDNALKATRSLFGQIGYETVLKTLGVSFNTLF